MKLHKTIFNRKTMVPLALALTFVVGGAGALGNVAHADTLPSTSEQSSTSAAGHHGSFLGKVKHMLGGKSDGNFEHNGVGGTITSISGSTITVIGRDTKTYTVNAASAKFEKLTPPATANPSNSSQSSQNASMGTAGQTAGTSWQHGKPTVTSIAITDLHVGDMIMVRGTVTGTSVVATDITTGMPVRGDMHGEMMGALGDQDKHPGAFGTVTAITGSTITLTEKNNTVVTVDASNSKFLKAPTPPAAGTTTTPRTWPTPTTITLADIHVGDTIRVEGAVNGSSITATSIIDGLPGHMMGPRMSGWHAKGTSGTTK